MEVTQPGRVRRHAHLLPPALYLVGNLTGRLPVERDTRQALVDAVQHAPSTWMCRSGLWDSSSSKESSGRTVPSTRTMQQSVAAT